MDKTKISFFRSKKPHSVTRMGLFCCYKSIKQWFEYIFFILFVYEFYRIDAFLIKPVILYARVRHYRARFLVMQTV